MQEFLRKFHSYNGVDDAFTHGCCYWFAAILFGRFIRSGAEIMFDKTANHFGTKIDGRVYDITGDVTERYCWISWSEMNDDDLKKQITKDYIKMD